MWHLWNNNDLLPVYHTDGRDIFAYVLLHHDSNIYSRVVLRQSGVKENYQKRSFASSKKSLFVIAPEKLLEETLQGLKENGFGYTQIVAAATDADLKGKTICEIPIVANHDGIVDYACEEWVDEVLIPPCAESEYPDDMVANFIEMGIAVHRGITKTGHVRQFQSDRKNR